MKTKQQVIDFLESKVGTTVVCVGNPSLDGQCVTLIKSLMEFLGVPNPYKARGHAKTVISAYLAEGIAEPGIGFLSVFSNKDMGGGYGHIWCNAGDGTYYESNGAKPLIVTKGKTYSFDAVCNFDKYISQGGEMVEVEAKVFEELVKKSSEYDKFVDAGYKSVDDVLLVTSKLNADIESKEQEILKLSEQLEDCQQPVTDFTVTGKKVIKHPDGQETIEMSYKVAER